MRIGKWLRAGVMMALAVSAVAAAPAQVGLAAPSAVHATALTGGEWQLVSFGPASQQTAVLPGPALTLTFGSDGQASGNAGCNNFNGAFHPGDTSLTFDPLASTKRACADNALNTQETAYLAALQAVTSYSLNGDQLTLTGPSSALHFGRAAGSSAAWERAQFSPTWDLAQPAGWMVNAIGAASGTLQLTGPWQGHTYKVTLSYPADHDAASLEEWVTEQLDPLPGSPADFAMTNLVAAGVPARLVHAVPAGDEPAPRELVYLWQTSATAPRLIVVTQTDTQAYDAVLLAAFAQEFAVQLRDPLGAQTPPVTTPPTNPPTSTTEARVPGIIDYHSDGTAGVLTAPATATVGQPFLVTIVTYGGGCERAADAAALVFADGAALVAYDFTRATTPDVVCTAILQRLTHTVTVRFDKPGDMVLRLWGRRVGPETPAVGVPTVIEQHVIVQ